MYLNSITQEGITIALPAPVFLDDAGYRYPAPLMPGVEPGISNLHVRYVPPVHPIGTVSTAPGCPAEGKRVMILEDLGQETNGMFAYRLEPTGICTVTGCLLTNDCRFLKAVYGELSVEEVFTPSIA